MGIYFEKRRNQYLVQFEMGGRMYRKRFPITTPRPTMKWYETEWRAFIRKTEAPSQSIVYLFHLNGYHKIGITNNVEARRALLSSNMPFEVEIVISYRTPFARIHERTLHNRFHDKRVKGEWFQLSPTDVKYFCDIANGEREIEILSPLSENQCVDLA